MAETRSEKKPALWETDVEHPRGGLWRVRTQDLQEEPLQMPAEMIKVLIGNRGRFVTTVYGPDAGQYKMTHTYTRPEAEEYHERMVEQISSGLL
jgi:hypothetical protein